MVTVSSPALLGWLLKACALLDCHETGLVAIVQRWLQAPRGRRIVWAGLQGDKRGSKLIAT